MWKVESSESCKICGAPIKNKRFRTFCSKKCRTRSYSIKYREARRLWQFNKRGEYKKGKLQCIICKKWYVQVGSHVQAVHKITAREYREEYNLPLKRGVVPRWYRQKKGDQALSNGTVANLKKGKRYRYRKGDPRAKVKKGQHGFKSAAHVPASNFYE